MDLAHGQKRHCMLGACRHYKYDQGSHLETFPACDSIWSQNPWDKAVFPQTSTSLLFLDTLFCSSSSGWLCKMDWSQLTWDCAAGAAFFTRATDKAAHISILLLYTCTVAIMEPSMFCCLVLIGVLQLTEEFSELPFFTVGYFSRPLDVYSVCWV